MVSEMSTYQLRPISVSDFRRMGEAEIFSTDERLELVDGEIVAIPPMGPRHAAGIARLSLLLTTRLQGRALVRVQLPATLDDFSEPLPDLSITSVDPAFFAVRHPGPCDILWLVEVSDSSLGYDRLKKMRTYARNGVREVWIVNLIDHQLEVSRDPSLGEYQTAFALTVGESIAPLTFPEEQFDVLEILGPTQPALEA